MKYLIFAAIIWWFIKRSLCQQCPASYLRYSNEHSYCKPVNSSCPIKTSGVKPRERDQIVDLHNKYRSLVATGNERQAGGLPEASDMLQMVWDEELAAVAQRTAEQCVYEHDCSNCRRVENFSVGQNIAYLEKQCWGGQCTLKPVPDWKKVIKMFYDEVSVFSKRYVKSMTFDGKMYGHFTQIVWSRTWRIGCGYVAYQKGSGYRQLYFCNYGPAGNMMGTPLYKTGPSCSACPVNSCCGTSCKAPIYAGLCRMNKENEAPLYPPEGNYIFYCDFRKAIGDCATSAGGANKWKYVQALGGSFVEVILRGGETSTMTFKKSIRPKQSFCLTMKYRSGPTVDGQKSSSKAVVNLKQANSSPMTMNLPTIKSKEFFEYRMSLNWSSDTKVTVTFSVPQGEPEQYFNMQLVAAKTGACQ